MIIVHSLILLGVIEGVGKGEWFGGARFHNANKVLIYVGEDAGAGGLAWMVK
jgi:hypothetical protein